MSQREGKTESESERDRESERPSERETQREGDSDAVEFSEYIYQLNKFSDLTAFPFFKHGNISSTSRI